MYLNIPFKTIKGGKIGRHSNSLPRIRLWEVQTNNKEIKILPFASLFLFFFFFNSCHFCYTFYGVTVKDVCINSVFPPNLTYIALCIKEQDMPLAVPLNTWKVSCSLLYITEYITANMYPTSIINKFHESQFLHILCMRVKGTCFFISLITHKLIFSSLFHKHNYICYYY